MKAVAALVLGVIVGAVAACGGTTKGTPGLDERSEILALWTQIRDWRREAHMELDPSPQTVFQLRLRTVKDAERVCPDGHKVPTSCNDVCNLGDAICDNADSICILADKLGKADDWAQEKCASAKASCREAKQKCCACSAKDPAAGATL